MLRVTSNLLFVPALFLSIICAAAQNSAPSSWVYSTYFGGSQSDTINAITLDSVGNVYVAGSTTSPDFPTTPGVYEQQFPGSNGDSAIFVAKFSRSGSLLWSTFLGPGTYEFTVASGLGVDSNQNVYVAGIFETSGFPHTLGMPNNGSVFISKLNATGTQLLYSGMLGGNSIDAAPKLVLDRSANAFVTGTGDLCCNRNTGIIGPLGGGGDFWVAEIKAAGQLGWSVEIGGADLDEADGLAIDADNKLYVTGYTGSLDFPVTPGALNQNGLGRTFVVKLDPSLSPSSSMVYGALVGTNVTNGQSFISGQSIAVDLAGDAFVGAWTYNAGLLTSPHAFQKMALTPPDGYVFQLNESGSAIVAGSYLGGNGDDFVGQVAVDNLDNVYASGFTESTNFISTAYGMSGPAYYAKLNQPFAATSAVEFPAGGAILAPDGAGGAWVAGYVGNSAFPTTANAFQPSLKGNSNAYLVHTNFAPLCGNGRGVEICGIAADSNSPKRVHFSAQASDIEQTTRIVLSIDQLNIYGLNAAQFDTWLPVAPGNHVATVRSWKNRESEAQQAFHVETSATCPLNPEVPSITLCAPLNAAVLQSPFHIRAVSNAMYPPPKARIFVDGKLQATVTGNGTYTYAVKAAPGVHTVAVKGIYGDGTFLYTSAVMKVVQ